MNNTQKTTYIIAIGIIVFLIANIFYSSRIITAFDMKKDSLIALNTEGGHGIGIEKKVDFISFESGFGFDLEVFEIPSDEVDTVSLAIPIKNLKPDTNYKSKFRFNLETNDKNPIQIKTNKGINEEQTSFNTDINYKPITIHKGNSEYDVELNFETNEDGVGYVIFDFNIDGYKNLKVNLNKVIINDFEEIEDDNISTEQSSEISLEIK